MRLFVALRLPNDSHAKAGIEGAHANGKIRGELVDLNITRLHPALRNINEYLRDSGALPEFKQPERPRRGRPSSKQQTLENNNQRLYWCEVETDLRLEDWYAMPDVEAVIAREEFNKFVLSIRCKSGAAYIAACEEYARKLPLHSEPRRSKAA
jgi:hypothetical protein